MSSIRPARPRVKPAEAPAADCDVPGAIDAAEYLPPPRRRGARELFGWDTLPTEDEMDPMDDRDAAYCLGRWERRIAREREAMW